MTLLVGCPQLHRFESLDTPTHPVAGSGKAGVPLRWLLLIGQDNLVRFCALQVKEFDGSPSFPTTSTGLKAIL